MGRAGKGRGLLLTHVFLLTNVLCLQGRVNPLCSNPKLHHSHVLELHRAKLGMKEVLIGEMLILQQLHH